MSSPHAPIIVEQGVPIPEVGNGVRRGMAPTYPWREMQVGDSFFIKQNGSTKKVLLRRLSVGASQACKRTGFHFVTRSVANGVRVWRDK